MTNTCLQITGGGKDLATAMTFGKPVTVAKKPSATVVVNTTTPRVNPVKLPTGLITKPNLTSYEVIKPKVPPGNTCTIHFECDNL